MAKNSGTSQAEGLEQQEHCDQSVSGQAAEKGSAKTDWSCWDWCGGGTRGGRGSHSRFGILLIAIGLLWLADSVGWIQAEHFWPLAMIAFGLWIGVFSRIRLKSKN